MAAKTSVVFVPKRNEVGVLHKTLSCFAQRDIDLSKIESRPFRAGDIALATAASLADASPLASPPPSKRARTSASGSKHADGAPPTASANNSSANFEYGLDGGVLGPRLLTLTLTLTLTLAHTLTLALT